MSPKQRMAFFAKKAGKPQGLGAPISFANPSQGPSNAGTVQQLKIPGLPKTNKFGRIKKNFKMGF